MPVPINRLELKKLKADKIRLEKEVTTLQSNIGELQNQHKITADSLNKAIADKATLTARYEAQIRSLNNTVESKDTEILRVTKENKKIPALNNQVIEFNRRIAGLESAIADKETYIKTLSDGNIALTNEKSALSATISQKDFQIDQLSSEIAAKTKAADQQKAHYESLIQKKDRDNALLEKKLVELREQGELDSDLIQEHEILKLQYKTLLLQHESRDQEYVKQASEFNALKKTHFALGKELENNRNLLLIEQQEKNKYKQELTTLARKLKSTFTIDDLSQQFMNSIDNFNKQPSTNEAVNYIIGEFDVDLKADLGRTDTGSIVLASPGFLINAEHGLSNIRFSIRAVPKINDE